MWLTGDGVMIAGSQYFVSHCGKLLFHQACVRLIFVGVFSDVCHFCQRHCHRPVDRVLAPGRIVAVHIETITESLHDQLQKDRVGRNGYDIGLCNKSGKARSMNIVITIQDTEDGQITVSEVRELEKGEAEDTVTSATALADAMFEVMDQFGEVDDSG